jgi:hypothetical protein
MRIKLIFLSILLLAMAVNSQAQTYPFKEGFEGLPSTQVPAGWQGDMKVLLYHGINDSKGVVGDIGSANEVDSIISPLIGPLTSSSVITFFYNIIDWANYPATPTNLGPGDELEVQMTTDGINYQTVFLIDENTHNPSFNFVRKKVYITQNAGDTVHIKFACRFGAGGRYFMDIDSVTVTDEAQVGINDVTDNSALVLFPNPCSNTTVCHLQSTCTLKANAQVYNIAGQMIYQANFVSATDLPAYNWRAGIYLVKITEEEKTYTRKLVIQN